MAQDGNDFSERDARLRAFILGDLIAESGNILTSELIDKIAKQIVKSVSDIIDNQEGKDVS